MSYSEIYEECYYRMFFVYSNTEERKPLAMALDVAKRKIYWGGDGDDGGLFVTNMDGSSTTKLVDYDHPTEINNIVLDAENQ